MNKSHDSTFQTALDMTTLKLQSSALSAPRILNYAAAAGHDRRRDSGLYTSKDLRLNTSSTLQKTPTRKYRKSSTSVSITPSAKSNDFAPSNTRGSSYSGSRWGWMPESTGKFLSKLSMKELRESLRLKLSPPGSPQSSPGCSPKGQHLLPAQRSCDDGKMTVVLDLDETLIHSEFTGNATNGKSLKAIMRQAEQRKTVTGAVPPDFTFVLYEGAPSEEVIHVYKRPGVDEFLSQLAEFCEVIIFTASLPVYAKPILAWLDPLGLCRHHLFRDSTMHYKNYPHVKSLERLGRNMRRTILVDNSPYAMLADPNNGIPIKAFYDDQNDTELPKLMEFIQKVSSKHDVRSHVKRTFKLPQRLTSLGFTGCGG